MGISDKDLKKIRKAIQEAARPLFFFDDDPDGVSSFIQLYQIKSEGKGVIVKAGSELKEEFARKVDEYQPDLVVVLDIPILSQEFIDRVSQKIIWLDHHPIVDRKGIDYYNPRFENEEDNRPTSYWAHKIAKTNLWLATVGCVGDWFIPDFKDEYIAKYPDLLSESITNPDDALFETLTGKLAMVISFNLKGSVTDSMNSVKVLSRIQSPYEILNSTSPRGKFLLKKFDKFNTEYQDILSKVKITNSPLIKFIYPYQRNAYTSELSNELLHKFPDKFIIVGRENNGEHKMSLRSKHHKVLPILTKALEKVNGKGGGHDYACGAVVKSEEADLFFKIIKEELKKAKPDK